MIIFIDLNIFVLSSEKSITNNNKSCTWLNHYNSPILSKNSKPYYLKLLLTKVEKDSSTLYLELSFI